MIERKTVAWPVDYAARHRNDHFIAETLSENLSELAECYPLSIDLENALRMSHAELSAFAREISNSVRSDINSVLTGGVTGSSKAGRSWRCFLDPEDRADSGAPSTGLIVRWTVADEWVSPDRLPQGLVNQIQRLFRTTVEKFRNYPRARGILLLDPHGAIRFTGDWWWARAFETVPVPPKIAEVWLATYDWVTDFEQGWIFERLHSLHKHPPPSPPHEKPG